MTRSPTIVHYQQNYPSNDGNSYIYKKDAGNGYVGHCTWYTKNGITTNADININSAYSWANSAQPGCYDVWSVFLHESGHAAGLAHSNTYSAVMYKDSFKNVTKRTLHSDDIAGIQTKY